MKDATEEAYIALKQKGISELFLLELRGLEFLFRPLTFAEYRTATNMDDKLTGPLINDYIVRQGVLYGEPSGYDVDCWLDKAPAIFPDQLAEAVLNMSGFQDQDLFLEILKEKRENVQKINSLIQIFICSAFRSLRPDEVDDMTLIEQLDLFAKAEEILDKKIDLEAVLKGKPTPKMPPSAAVPIPEGMDSTDMPPEMILSPELADKPDMSKIFGGEETY
jgi:hypothetical protein